MITLTGAAAGVVLGMELEAATPSAAPPTVAILRTGHAVTQAPASRCPG